MRPCRCRDCLDVRGSVGCIVHRCGLLEVAGDDGRWLRGKEKGQASGEEGTYRSWGSGVVRRSCKWEEG